MAAPRPNSLPPSLLPRTAEERQQFAKWFREGWRAGRRQANQEFQLRVRRLKREYLGMLKYRELVAKGVITQIVLARSEFGMSVEGPVLRIEDRTVEIVSAAAFETHRNRWRLPAIGSQSVIGRGQQ